jgi:chemotaxis protein MotA
MARQLMDIAAVAKKKGLLALAGAEAELKKDPQLYKAVQIVTDGYSANDIERILSQDLDALVERHRRSASILRRASEISPAMGLIGTLIGLVQMLANLSDPEAIGPAMAVALLTTFYGAILGTAVLSPMAAKLERNSNEEAMLRSMIMITMSSIARQDNPRRLEMLLNSELPPSEQIRYFD